MRTESFADLVVAVCLGEIDDDLPPPAECMELLELNSPIATAQFTDPVEIEDWDTESIVETLEGFTSDSRCEAIKEGASLTQEEKQHVICAATKNEFDSGSFSAIEYFRLTDSKGRSVYFSARSNSDCGSWARSSDHDGPLLDLPYDKDTEIQEADGTFLNFCIYG
jgi:hypothetical protein